MSNKIASFLLFLLLSTYGIAADLPQFAFPVDCELNKTCWLVNHVDVDPTENAKDFSCGLKTYDGHKGTDFAIRSRAEMNEGVDVLAAKDGAVLRIRDGENDDEKTKEQIEIISSKDRDCGNGVLLSHGQGLQTFYCHMKNGSIIVKPGDKIAQGQKLGEIGQSGASEFPHLHFSVIWEGGHVDPFTSHLKEEGCGKFKDNMFQPDLSYDPIILFDGAFKSSVPDFAQIRAGEEKPESIPQNSSALVYWIALYHAHAGDQVEMKITDPRGKIFNERKITVEKHCMRQYFYTGRKTTQVKLIPGTYTGAVRIKRTGQADKIVTHTIEIKQE